MMGQGPSYKLADSQTGQLVNFRTGEPGNWRTGKLANWRANIRTILNVEETPCPQSLYTTESCSS